MEGLETLVISTSDIDESQDPNNEKASAQMARVKALGRKCVFAIIALFATNELVIDRIRGVTEVTEAEVSELAEDPERFARFADMDISKLQMELRMADNDIARRVIEEVLESRGVKDPERYIQVSMAE